MTWEACAVFWLTSMSSFAIVILSLFSPAISSSTGATILHGPHHSAQKSTRTVLSLLRTSLSKLASVTSTVFLAMVVSFVREVGGQSAGDGGDLVGRLAVAAARELAGHGALGEPAFGVDGRRTAGTGRRDGLPVRVVDEVAAGEHAGDLRVRGGGVDVHVARVVEIDLVADQRAARVVADGDEHPRDLERALLARAGVAQAQALDAALAEHFGDLGVGDPADLGVLAGALEHDARGAEFVAAV